MTTLSALWDWLAASKAVSGSAANGGDTDFRLRTLPREEIHVYVKPIDNTKVVMLVDKKDWAASLGMAGGVVVASLLLIALLLPGGFNLLASHRMEQLKNEREMLVNELRDLRSQEAEMRSPQNLEQWAGERFSTPQAASVVFAPPTKGTVASLR